MAFPVNPKTAVESSEEAFREILRRVRRLMHKLSNALAEKESYGCRVKKLELVEYLFSEMNNERHSFKLDPKRLGLMFNEPLRTVIEASRVGKTMHVIQDGEDLILTFESLHTKGFESLRYVKIGRKGGLTVGRRT